MAQVALVASDDVSSTYPLNPASVTSLSAAASRTLSGSDAQITISAPSAVSTTARAGMTSGCATPGAGVACGRAEGAGGASIQATFTAGSDTVILARTVADRGGAQRVAGARGGTAGVRQRGAAGDGSTWRGDEPARPGVTHAGHGPRQVQGVRTRREGGLDRPATGALAPATGHAGARRGAP